MKNTSNIRRNIFTFRIKTHLVSYQVIPREVRVRFIFTARLKKVCKYYVIKKC